MKSSVKKKAADFYDKYHANIVVSKESAEMQERARAFYRMLLENLKPSGGSRLLDLSCGQGMFLQSVSTYDSTLELHGLDHSKFAVAESRKVAPKARLKVGDAMATGYPARYFDTITCLGSLEHYPDSRLGLREIRRILKDDGRALILVPNLFFIGYIYLVWKSGETPHEAGQNQYERFETRQGWEDLMKSEGLKVVQTLPYNDMFATSRVPNWMKFVYTWFVQPFVPLNFAYAYNYIVEKDPDFRPQGRR